MCVFSPFLLVYYSVIMCSAVKNSHTHTERNGVGGERESLTLQINHFAKPKVSVKNDGMHTVTKCEYEQQQQQQHKRWYIRVSEMVI